MPTSRFANTQFTIETGDTYPRQLRPWLAPDVRGVLVEPVLREGDRASEPLLSDLNMLVLLSGRKRTAREYGALLEAGGLRLPHHRDRVTRSYYRGVAPSEPDTSSIA